MSRLLQKFMTVGMVLQNVPYVFVPSKAALGRACGVTRPVRHLFSLHRPSSSRSLASACFVAEDILVPVATTTHVSSCMNVSWLDDRQRFPVLGGLLAGELLFESVVSYAGNCSFDYVE